MSDLTFHDFAANTITGQAIDFSVYKGHPVLVVNTASKCGLAPQLKGLETLHQRYKDEGLVILGFPCNQFGNQEPGDSEDIAEVCQINYGVSFQMMEKIEVNGKNTHPVYEYLKGAVGPKLIKMIKWNFTKFLIDQNGIPVKRYAPTVAPRDIEEDLKTELEN